MPYLFIILVIFSMSSIAYFTVFDRIESNELKIQEAYMEQSKLVLDRRFKEVTEAIYQLKDVPIVNAFKTLDREALEKNHFPATELSEGINNLRIVNQMIDDYFIFYKDSNVVANLEGLYYYDNLQDHELYNEDMTKEGFWDHLFANYYDNAYQSVVNYKGTGNNFQAIPVISTLGFDKSNPKAVIYMILNGDKFKENMTGYAEQFDGNFFIVDDQGKVMLSLNEGFGVSEGYINESDLEENYFTITAESDVIPWRYVLVQSQDQVFEEINQFRFYGNVLIMVIFAIGLMISFVMARYNSKPLIALIDNNTKLEERVNHQIPYLRLIFLERWLKGNYDALEDLTSITKFLKTKYEGDYYCVVVIDTESDIQTFDIEQRRDYKDYEINRMRIRDILVDGIIEADFIHDISRTKFALIFIGDHEDEKAFRTYVDKQVTLCHQTLAENKINGSHFGIGNIYKEMSGVATSLSNALDAVSISNMSEEDAIQWYEELEGNNNVCYYPAELEVRLYNATRAGELVQMTQILRDVLRINILEKNLSIHMQNVFIYELWGTLAKVQERALGNDQNVNDVIREAFDKMVELSDVEKIHYCEKIFQRVCGIYADKRKDKHINVLKDIDAYILNNFRDSQLSLDVIADEFNLSYTYVSEIIKDYKDKTFVNYLQEIRMKEAEHLLVSTDLRVKEILHRCGYNSNNTFGKAFKRTYGVSASVYREKKKE